MIILHFILCKIDGFHKYSKGEEEKDLIRAEYRKYLLVCQNLSPHMRLDAPIENQRDRVNLF